jgi:hypothetical protein
MHVLGCTSDVCMEAVDFSSSVEMYDMVCMYIHLFACMPACMYVFACMLIDGCSHLKFCAHVACTARVHVTNARV